MHVIRRYRTLHKTTGWALISGVLIMGAALVAKAEFWPAIWATVGAVALKTPAYWAWEHVFERFVPRETACAE